MKTDYFQLIPLLILAGYFCYLTYYIAAPMFYLRILLFLAYKKFRCSTVRFGEEKITVNVLLEGEERVLEKYLDADPSSRFFVMALCLALKSILKDIKKGKALSAD
ncbi:MAG: hypothetical protein IJG40_07810 [Oscillospiraceae bacterium]|nr:hypothetical protein [Oscillospiraceae bacterium]